jgi:hypothetical protein
VLLDRIGGTPRLYRWLLVLGAAVLASPVLLTASAHGTVASYQEWTTSLTEAVDSLRVLTRDAEAAGDPALPEYDAALADQTAELDRAVHRLDRARQSARQLWHVTGRGPLLLAAGAGLLLLGLRLRRFEQYGD